MKSIKKGTLALWTLGVALLLCGQVVLCGGRQKGQSKGTGKGYDLTSVENLAQKNQDKVMNLEVQVNDLNSSLGNVLANLHENGKSQTVTDSIVSLIRRVNTLEMEVHNLKIDIGK